MKAQKKTSRYEIDMASGAIGRKMVVYAFPLICSSLLQIFFNTADTVVVGRFSGDDPLAAVGAAAALFHLITNLLIGISTGVNVVVARYIGANKEKDISEAVHTTMVLALISAVLMGVIGFFVVEPILKLMGTPDSILPLSVKYLKIICLAGIPFMNIFNYGGAILRAKGDTKRPLYYLSAAGVLNIALNLLFVIKFGMDVDGVAWATAISQMLSTLLVVRCLIHEDEKLRIYFKKLKLSPDKTKQILSIGIPAGLQGCMFSLSNMFIQSAINGFGKVVMAGSSAASSLENFTYVAVNSFSQAGMSFTSQNLGAGKNERIKPVILYAVMFACIISVVMGLSTCIFGKELVGIYTKTPASIEAGAYRLWFVAGPYLLFAPMDVFTSVIRGLNHSLSSTAVSLIGICFLRIVFLTTLFNQPEFHTIEWVYLTWPISWVITGAAQFILLRKIYKTEVRPGIKAK